MFATKKRKKKILDTFNLSLSLSRQKGIYKMSTGRGEKIVDWKLVNRKLIAGCNGTEIASCLGMHHDTFYRKVEETYGISFTAYQQEKHFEGCANIREVQYNKAIEGDNSMLIWLGKNRLKQADSPQEISVSGEVCANFKALMTQISSLQSSKSPSQVALSMDDISNNADNKS